MFKAIKNPFASLPREVAILSTVSFLVAVGFGLIIPAIPIFAASFGVSKTAIGLIISCFAIVRFASGLVSGRLVDKFGERALIGAAIGYFILGLVSLVASFFGVGPILVGLLTDNFSFQVAFLFSAGIWIIALALSAVLPETRASHIENDLIPDKNKQEL